MSNHSKKKTVEAENIRNKQQDQYSPDSSQESIKPFKQEIKMENKLANTEFTIEKPTVQECITVTDCDPFDPSQFAVSGDPSEMLGIRQELVTLRVQKPSKSHFFRISTTQSILSGHIS